MPVTNPCSFCLERILPPAPGEGVALGSPLPPQWLGFCTTACKDAAQVREALGKPRCVVCEMEVPSASMAAAEWPVLCSLACAKEWAAPNPCSFCEDSIPSPTDHEWRHRRELPQWKGFCGQVCLDAFQVRESLQPVVYRWAGPYVERYQLEGDDIRDEDEVRAEWEADW